MENRSKPQWRRLQTFRNIPRLLPVGFDWNLTYWYFKNAPKQNVENLRENALREAADTEKMTSCYARF